MQYGYVMCDPKRSKVVVLTKQGDVEYITANVTFKHQQFFLRDKTFKKI